MDEIIEMNGEPTRKTVRGSYTFGPTIEYWGSSFNDVMDSVNSFAETEAGVSFTILPQNFEDKLKKSEKDILSFVKDHLIEKEGGLAYFSKSLADEVGLTGVQPSTDIICDVLVITKSDIPYILSFSKKADSHSDLRYNLWLAKSVLKKLRLLISEEFTFAFGLVRVQDIESKEKFKKRLRWVKSCSTRFAMRKYRAMTSAKCDAIIRGCVTMIGISNHLGDGKTSSFNEDDTTIRIRLTRDKLRKMMTDR